MASGCLLCDDLKVRTPLSLKIQPFIANPEWGDSSEISWL